MSNIKIQDVFQRIQYSATAGQTEFTVPFPFFDDTDLVVYSDATELTLTTDYTITGAGSPSGGLVTLVVAASEDDIITIQGLMPIDRTSIYSATISNLTGSDLNSDFNRDIVMLKQLETTQALLQLQYKPYLEISQDEDVTRDRWLPLLDARESWRMNAAHTEIETFVVPDGDLAPGGAKYIVQEPNLFLPNAQALNALSNGFMFNTGATGVVGVRTIEGTANQITLTNGTGIGGNPTIGIAPDPIIPGNEGMGIPTGTTAQRVVPGSPDISLRFNTDLDYVEYYDHDEADWQQLGTAQDVLDLIARLAAHTNGDGASMIGLEDLGSVSDKTVQDLAQATFLAQTDNGTLTNAQFMADLDTGITKNTTATGVQTVLAGSSGINAVINDDTMATAGTDNLSTSIAIKNYIDNLDGGSVKSVTGKANEIDVDNTDPQNPLLSLPDTIVMPGTVGVSIPVGNTSERVTPTPPNINLRFNTDTDAVEYYDHDSAMWVSIPSSESGIYLEIAGGTMAGDIDMDVNRIIGLPGPTDPGEAVNKAYVDSIAFNTHPAANYAFTGDFDATYDNGTAGVGATLTANSNGVLTVDGQNPGVNNRILVLSQTDAFENGIYVVTQQGDAGNPAIITRSDDYNEADDMHAGDLVAVVGGDTLAGHTFMMSQTATIIVGTTDITWQQVTAHPGGISGAMQYNSGGLFGGDDNIITDGSGNQEIDGSLTVDDVHINGNTVTSNLTNGDINIQGAGTGNTRIHGLAYPKVDGVADAIMQTDGSGNLNLNPLDGLKGLSLVQTITASTNASSLTMTDLPSNRYMVLYFDNFLPTEDNVDLVMQFSVNNGASWIDGASYSMESLFLSRNAATVSASHMSNGHLLLCSNHANSRPSAGKIDLFRPNNATLMRVMSKIFYTRIGDEIAQYHAMGGVTQNAGVSPPINAIRLRFVAPALISAGGRVDLYAV